MATVSIKSAGSSFKRAHLPIDGKTGSKPAPSVMNERAQFVAQASSSAAAARASLQPMQPGMAALRSESPSIGRCAPFKLLLTLVLCLAAGHVRGLAQTQDDVTVAFLYNFARFVEWPPASFASADAPFTIGFVGRPALAEKLARAVQGKNAGGREFNIRSLDGASAATSCQMVFVGDASQASAVLAAVKGKPVLCVGEGEAFLAAGGMIAFDREGARLVFDVNRGAIAAATLSPSEKLTKAARSVKGG